MKEIDHEWTMKNVSVEVADETLAMDAQRSQKRPSSSSAWEPV